VMKARGHALSLSVRHVFCNDASRLLRGSEAIAGLRSHKVHYASNSF
jgi:hypothetical protein